MDKAINYIKITAVALGATIGGFLGGWDVSIQVLIALTAIDFITGVLTGFYTKKLSSNVGYKGLIKKVGIYLMVGTACLLDKAINTGATLRTSMVFFYIAIEGISILENWGKMDLPLPGFIKKALEQLKEQSDGGNHD